MNYTWIYVFLVMMAGNMALHVIPVYTYSGLVAVIVGVNFAVLAASFFIFRRDRYFSDFRANMLFMVGLTAINILTQLGILSYMMSWLAFGALFVWSMAGGGRSR